MSTQPPVTDAQLRDKAAEEHGVEGEVEISPNAVVSRSRYGAWVAAWVWVAFD